MLGAIEKLHIKYSRSKTYSHPQRERENKPGKTCVTHAEPGEEAK